MTTSILTQCTCDLNTYVYYGRSFSCNFCTLPFSGSPHKPSNRVMKTDTLISFQWFTRCRTCNCDSISLHRVTTSTYRNKIKLQRHWRYLMYSLRYSLCLINYPDIYIQNNIPSSAPDSAILNCKLLLQVVVDFICKEIVSQPSRNHDIPLQNFLQLSKIWIWCRSRSSVYLDLSRRTCHSNSSFNS